MFNLGTSYVFRKYGPVYACVCREVVYLVILICLTLVVEGSWFLEFPKLWGKCEEMANIASFMISEQNSYMTGTTIYSDGGWTAK